MDEARKAKDKALALNESIDQRWPLVHALSEALKKSRQENHFADRITQAFERRQDNA